MTGKRACNLSVIFGVAAFGVLSPVCPTAGAAMAFKWLLFVRNERLRQIAMRRKCACVNSSGVGGAVSVVVSGVGFKWRGGG